MTPHEWKLQLKAEAERLGFSLFGVAPATDADGFTRFESWLHDGFHGEMSYLERNREARRHPRSISESVRSVVMLGLEYGGWPLLEKADSFPISSVRGGEGTNPVGRVAAYACGPDYHDFIWVKLNVLRDWLENQLPGTLSRGVTDSAPLLERDFARRAGLGWFGKNTMLINKHRGSFFFLAALLTSVELPADEPHHTKHCGTCTACLDACPTQAFPAPGVLDARKCISYLTIETKTAFPLELREQVGEWLFGCDVCQDVCPWNRNASERDTSAFPANPEMRSLDAVEVLRISETEFRNRFRDTPLSRPKWQGLRRNAAIVLGNTGSDDVLPVLELYRDDPNEVVRDAVRWAIDRIQSRRG